MWLIFNYHTKISQMSLYFKFSDIFLLILHPEIKQLL